MALLARVDPGPGGGAGLRLTADMFLLEAGLRVVAVFLGDPECQIMGTIGFGRY